MRPHVLAIDAVLAAGLAAVALILSPGVALTAVIALLVLLVGAVSFGIEGLVVRRRRRG